MLQLNKIFLCLTALLLSGLFFSSAQDSGENIAVLLEGPIPFEGIPGIGDNVIPGFRGRYSLEGSPVDVYYTSDDVIVFSEWNIVQKKGFTFYEVSDNELFFVNKDKWALFIVYDRNITLIYEFAVEICSKMLFFAKTEEFFKVSSFPAIININR